VRPFTQKQIKLLETFADQAVIAIENVRLFKELQDRNAELREALEHQTATSDILRVIATASTDVAPVFEAICDAAVRLFDAYGGTICRFDGTLVHLAAIKSPNPDADERARRHGYPCAPESGRITARAILAKDVVQIPDTETDPFDEARSSARDFGYRRALAVPMMREGEVIGSIAVAGREPGTYSERQVQLLKTFADQAVIAIENVRLFTELQARTAELTRSVGQLTALGEVGQDLLKRLGMKIDFRVSDWGTLVQRRSSKEPPERGGWNMFHTTWNGIDGINPGVMTYLRANGANAWFGWPDVPAVETEVNNWFEAKSLDEEKAAIARLNKAALDNVVYAPTGFFLTYQAWRKNVNGIVKGPIPFFWDVSKTA
jgi:GAF domain-containing protein